jgi:hypothetical protein
VISAYSASRALPTVATDNLGMESTRMLADANRSIVPPFPTRSVQKPDRRKVSRWISFQIWFNAYRCVAEINQRERPLFLTIISSKLYILVVSINFTGMVLAVNGTWMYPRHYSGACVLGNLLMAILMRNELFGRLLYIVVNTLFAKVALLHLHFYILC